MGNINFADILAILGLIFGSGGLYYAYIYRKENKALKSQEVKTAQYTSESTFIQNVEKATDIYKETIDFQKQQISDLEKYHKDKYDLLDQNMSFLKEQVSTYKEKTTKNQKEITTLSTNVKLLQRELNENKEFICFDIQCMKRKSQKI